MKGRRIGRSAKYNIKLPFQMKPLLCLFFVFFAVANGMPHHQRIPKIQVYNHSITLKVDPELFLKFLKESDPQLALKLLPTLLGKDNIHLIRRKAKASSLKNKGRDQREQHQELDEFGHPTDNRVFRLY